MYALMTRLMPLCGAAALALTLPGCSPTAAPIDADGAQDDGFSILDGYAGLGGDYGEEAFADAAVPPPPEEAVPMPAQPASDYSYAPPVERFPATQPIPYDQDYNDGKVQGEGGDDSELFALIGAAALLGGVLGDSPPDYYFDYGDTSPWAWETGDRYASSRFNDWQRAGYRGEAPHYYREAAEKTPVRGAARRQKEARLARIDAQQRTRRDARQRLARQEQKVRQQQHRERVKMTQRNRNQADGERELANRSSVGRNSVSRNGDDRGNAGRNVAGKARLQRAALLRSADLRQQVRSQQGRSKTGQVEARLEGAARQQRTIRAERQRREQNHAQQAREGQAQERAERQQAEKQQILARETARARDRERLKAERAQQARRAQEQRAQEQQRADRRANARREADAKQQTQAARQQRPARSKNAMFKPNGADGPRLWRKQAANRI